LARKPVPVQVTYIAYPGTTGLTAIDYRLSDPYLDPQAKPGKIMPKIYSEETRLLSNSFWCYDLLGTEADVNELPALSAGHVTFGCLNNFCKVNEAVVQTWARVLLAVPNSRMIILCGEGNPRRWVAEIFERGGVSADRIEFIAPLSSPEYFRLYHRIDLALDTFPYNGHTTTLDGCWMGVPVVTRVGETAVGRGGLSMLFNLGLQELIAASDDHFVTVATEMALDGGRLAELRRTLRERMRASPLMDAPRFAADLEAAYRSMWREYCVTR
jgi:predicted O-linked N-acetylglucosamine transferase (SPINDLY family)